MLLLLVDELHEGDPGLLLLAILGTGEHLEGEVPSERVEGVDDLGLDGEGSEDEDDSLSGAEVKLTLRFRRAFLCLRLDLENVFMSQN